MGRKRSLAADKRNESQQRMAVAAGVLLVVGSIWLTLPLSGQDLFNAAKTGQAEAVRRLIAEGADPDLQNLWWNEKMGESISDMPTALMAAVQVRFSTDLG